MRKPRRSPRQRQKAEAEAKARKEAEVAKKLDVGDLKQFLQNKEKNQSTGATGTEVQKTASLGTQTGTAAKLNPSSVMRSWGFCSEQIARCYTAPIERVSRQRDGSSRRYPSQQGWHARSGIPL